ncbi:MAG: hypothetical protein AAF550_09595 [Myxococcota bacterium]
MIGPSLQWIEGSASQNVVLEAGSEELVATLTDELVAAKFLGTSYAADTPTHEELDAVPSVFLSHDWGGASGRREQVSIEVEAETIALYLVRFWKSRNPFWSDIAARRAFDHSFPVAKCIQTALVNAMAIRLELSSAQSKTAANRFERECFRDLCFFRMASLALGGVSHRAAARETARWCDGASGGQYTLKASSLEKDYPKWTRDPLLGLIWVRQINQLRNDAPELFDAKQEELLSRMPSLSGALVGIRR